MYAEISIHFVEAIHRERLFAGMPASTDHARALGQTVFRTTPEFADTAVYSQVVPSRVFVVFPVGADSLRVHVENTVDRGSIAKLKGSAEEVVRTLVDAGKRAQCRCDDTVIRIHSEDSMMQEGRRIPLGQRLAKRFRETVVGDILVGATSAVVGLALGLDPKNSVLSGMAVLLALLIWVLLEVGFGLKRYEYEDV